MRKIQAGLSLVEVLVAVAIGMIGILIITQAYVTGDNFNRATLGEGGAQTNGLIGLYTIERDARMSGYGFNNDSALGCGDLFWHYGGQYSIRAGGALPNVALAPVVITADTVTPANPDQVAILYSSENERMTATAITAYSAAGNSVALGIVGFRDNDYLVLVQAGNCALAHVTSRDPGSQVLYLASSSPSNPAAMAGFPVYAANDTVLNLGAVVHRIYGIGGGKLRSTETLLTTGVATPVEIVDGIVDLRALYGKDTNADNIVDRYDLTTPASAAEWIQVQALKIAILARIGTHERGSVGAAECDATTVMPAWSGSALAGPVMVANPFRAVSVAAGSEDRCYRYRVFETTIPLRNMIWRAS